MDLQYGAEHLVERGVGCVRPLEPRLGWLETFLVVAHHLDYGLAGDELGITDDNVRKTIRRLEKWSYRTLVDSAGSLKLHEPNGEELVLAVIDVLTMFDNCRAISARPTRGVLVGTRENLRLSDFGAVLDVARYQTYQQVDKFTGKSSNVRRNISSIESVLGRVLFVGKPKLKVAQGSEDVIESVKKIVERLRFFRRDPKDSLIYFHILTRKHLAMMKVSISVWERRKRLSPLARRDMAEVRAKMKILEDYQKGIDYLLAVKFGIVLVHLPVTSAAYIDMADILSESDR